MYNRSKTTGGGGGGGGGWGSGKDPYSLSCWLQFHIQNTIRIKVLKSSFRPLILEKVEKTSSKMIFFTFYDFFPRKRTQPCQRFKIVGSDTKIKEVENFVFNCGILGSRSKAFWKCCTVSGSVYNQSATFGGGKKNEGMRMRSNTAKNSYPNMN
jgi:hypothetical protein